MPICITRIVMDRMFRSRNGRTHSLMIPYTWEMEFKLRVIKAMLGMSNETSKELWNELMKALSDGPRLEQMKGNDDD